MIAKHLLAVGMVFLFLTCTLCSCSPSSSNSLNSTYCQGIIEAVASVPTHPELPDGTAYEDFMQGLADGTIEGFDVNEYFSVLPNLSMEAGYTLDYVYLADHLGGKPLVYARPENQPAYTTYDEYVEAIEGAEQRSYEYLESSADYLEHIEIDDTAEGYFQFVVLWVMGDQFYLFWHGEYNDTRIVCSHDGMESALEEAAAFASEVPADVRKAAAKIDFEPRIEFLDETAVTVRFVTFTKWGGFTEIRYTISREFPHTVTDWEVKTLVEYDCGIRF